MDELIQNNNSNPFIINGVLIGIIIDNKDPEKLGRVKVKYPLLEQTLESDWVRKVSFMTGNGYGGYFLPEIGDEVLLSFQFGDINHPFVIGALWNGVDKPPQTNEDGQNNIREIKSRSGHIIKFNDKGGEETIEIVDKSAQNSLTISTKDNTIMIRAAKDINIKAPKGTVTIEGHDIAIQATNSLKANGATIDLKAQAQMQVEAGTTANLKAGGVMNVKGAIINLN